MQWKVKSNKPARLGDHRVVSVFAWFPKTIGTTRVWLESYMRYEIFIAPGRMALWHPTALKPFENTDDGYNPCSKQMKAFHNICRLRQTSLKERPDLPPGAVEL